MPSAVSTVVITSGAASDPPESVADRTRRLLDPALADARRGRVCAVVIDVESDAWDWQWDGGALSSREVAAQHHDLVVRVLSATVPVVVRLDGTVSGLGLALALACDLRFATGSARLRVGAAGSPDGVLTGVPWLLRDRLGSARALELLLTGRELDAEESRSTGLVCDADFDTVVRALASAPSAVTSATVRSLSATTVTAYVEHLTYESWLGELASGGHRA